MFLRIVFTIRRRAAVSLVEVLIALTVGVVAFFPILSLFQSGVKDSLYATSWTQAREFAKGYMDRVCAMNFDELTDTGVAPLKVDGIPNYFPKQDNVRGTIFYTDCNIESVTPAFEYRTVNRARQLIPAPPAPPYSKQILNKLKKITVTVKWKGMGNNQGAAVMLEYKLATLKADLYKGTVDN
ncbi:MAG TPA: hypothetical protein PKK26_10240 [Candidatus Wallbacteria bacterium]|nr:hypothetical protein [Candidatus Wallbacteria bacterium]